MQITLDRLDRTFAADGATLTRLDCACTINGEGVTFTLYEPMLAELNALPVDDIAGRRAALLAAAMRYRLGRWLDGRSQGEQDSLDADAIVATWGDNSAQL